jgi:hypothetical protein
MAFWQTSSISDINIGTSPNDGTGDNIRASFSKVDSNFSNISSFLSGTRVDFLNANVSFNLLSNYITVANLFVANATGTTASFSSNITAGNVIANSAIYATSGIYNAGITSLVGNASVGGALTITGQSSFGANMSVAGSMIPAVNGLHDLGTASNRFRTVYSLNTDAATQIQSSSDAGLLLVHANASIGDFQDTGILGNITSDFGGANTYCFFGYQPATDNFAFKITNTNATKGNNVVYDGVYGNAQLGGLFLSNSTISSSPTTGALIVNGGAGITGNINAANSIIAPTYYGNIVATVANVTRMAVSGTISNNLSVDGLIYSSGSQVVTTGQLATLGLPAFTGVGSLFVGNTVFTSTGTSTSNVTGAVVIFGGLGVGAGTTGGNINVYGNVSAVGVVGTHYGLIATASQPNITGLGTLGNLNVTNTTTTGTLQATNIGVTNVTATGNVFVSTINGLTSLTIGGLLTTTTSTVGASFNNTYTSGTISAAGATTLDTFTATTYTTAKYVVQIVDSGSIPSKVQASEILIIHDRNSTSTIPYLTEYGCVFNVTGGLGTFSTAYSAGLIQLIFTPNYTPTSMVIKVVRTSLTA